MGESKTGAKREKKAGNRFATSCGNNPDLVGKKKQQVCSYWLKRIALAKPCSPIVELYRDSETCPIRKTVS